MKLSFGWIVFLWFTLGIVSAWHIDRTYRAECGRSLSDGEKAVAMLFLPPFVPALILLRAAGEDLDDGKPMECRP